MKNLTMMLVFCCITCSMGSCEDEDTTPPVSCSDPTGEYLVTEDYEVVDGHNAGLTGSTTYTLEIIQIESGDSIIIKNFNYDFDLTGFILCDSFNIPEQYFIGVDSTQIGIWCKGRFNGDSLIYNYFSGSSESIEGKGWGLKQ